VLRPCVERQGFCKEINAKTRQLTLTLYGMVNTPQFMKAPSGWLLYWGSMTGSTHFCLFVRERRACPGDGVVEISLKLRLK